MVHWHEESEQTDHRWKGSKTNFILVGLAKSDLKTLNPGNWYFELSNPGLFSTLDLFVARQTGIYNILLSLKI
jgi:hypothetical protein